MLPWLGDGHGNPSGSHRLAREARRAVDDARDELAELVGCRPGEIVFTSGGTEADNLARARRASPTGRCPVCSAVDHHAVLDPVRARGGRVVAVDAAGPGRPRGPRPGAAGRRRRAHGRARVGAAGRQRGRHRAGPRRRCGRWSTREAPGAVLHTDAVQAFAWLDVAELAAPADLVSLSGHKFGGPSGVGRAGRPGAGPAPRRCSLGGGQERGRRSGTLPVAAIVGLAAGARACAEERKATVDRVACARATAWPTGCSPPSPARSRRPTAPTRSRRTATSASRASRPRRCCSCSTRRACARRRRRRARAARPSRRTCSPRSACPLRPRRRVAAAVARVDHHRRRGRPRARGRARLPWPGCGREGPRRHERRRRLVGGGRAAGRARATR